MRVASHAGRVDCEQTVREGKQIKTVASHAGRVDCELKLIFNFDMDSKDRAVVLLVGLLQISSLYAPEKKNSIHVFIEKIKSFSQKNYNKIINDFSFHKLSCTCKQKGSLIKHGYYNRSIKTPEGLIKLSIIRVYCKNCKKTHPILLSWIIPYSRILYHDQVAIIHAYLNHLFFEPIMLSKLLIDERNIRSIIHHYFSHWKERIASFGGVLFLSMVKLCFKYFVRQFMQIKCTPNILFMETT